MEFVVRKEDLFNGIRIVERATSVKGVQPVLANILIESINNSTLYPQKTNPNKSSKLKESFSNGNGLNSTLSILGTTASLGSDIANDINSVEQASNNQRSLLIKVVD